MERFLSDREPLGIPRFFFDKSEDVQFSFEFQFNGIEIHSSLLSINQTQEKVC